MVNFPVNTNNSEVTGYLNLTVNVTTSIPNLSKVLNMAVEGEIDSTANSNVKVVVRVRPQNSQESASNFHTVVQVVDERVLIFDPVEDDTSSFYHGKKRTGRDLLKKKNKDMQFAFDRVFNDQANNQEVYEQTTRSILDGLLNGYNCSVFAYGATGAGKTFTMLGSPLHPGVMFLTMMDLYNRIEEIKQDKTCEVAVSYLEVYNETIRDLLTPSGALAVREDPQRGVVVSGLTLHQPHDAKELLSMLESGNKNRTQHPTDANSESSRSHAVFQVYVKQRDRTANLTADVRVAKMCLIDLAGSERATVTTNRGARFREGANINRSLLALGNCINALADSKNKVHHIPYRNSKLTRLLKDSLGGNCRTIMIAAVSPSSMTYEDTYNTLKYANRAKSIQSMLKRNVVSVDAHISRYSKIVDELRQEVCELKSKLKEYDEGKIETNRRKSLVDVAHQEEINRLQNMLNIIFNERLKLRREIIESEGTEREMDIKIFRRQKTLERIGLVTFDSTSSKKVSSRMERMIEADKVRQAALKNRRLECEQRMLENVDGLRRLESEMVLTGENGQMSEILASCLQGKHLEVELRDLRSQVKYLKKYIGVQDKEMQSNESLISAVLNLVKTQYLVLKGNSLTTSNLDSEFENIQRLVEAKREVAWADQTSNTGLNLEETLKFSTLSYLPMTPESSNSEFKESSSTFKDSLTPLSILRSHNSTVSLKANTEPSKIVKSLCFSASTTNTPLECPTSKIQMEFPSTKTQLECSVTKTQLECPPTKTQLECPPTKTQLEFPSTKTQLECPPTKTQLECPATETLLEYPPTKTLLEYPTSKQPLEFRTTNIPLEFQTMKTLFKFPVTRTQFECPTNSTDNAYILQNDWETLLAPSSQQSSHSSDILNSTFTFDDVEIPKLQGKHEVVKLEKNVTPFTFKMASAAVLPFSEALKNPATRCLRSLSKSPDHFNFSNPIPQNPTENRMSRRDTFAGVSNKNKTLFQKQESHLPLFDQANYQKNLEALRRMALPAMIECKNGAKKRPAYMAMTATSASKMTRHRRSISAKENNQSYGRTINRKQESNIPAKRIRLSKPSDDVRYTQNNFKYQRKGVQGNNGIARLSWNRQK